MKNCKKFIELNSRGLITNSELKELVLMEVIPFYSEIELGWDSIKTENAIINSNNNSNYCWNYNFSFNNSNTDYTLILKSKDSLYNFIVTDFINYEEKDKIETLKELAYFNNYILDDVEDYGNMYCDNTGLCSGITCNKYSCCMA